MVIREYICVVSPANQLSQRNETIFYVPIYIEKRRGKKKRVEHPGRRTRDYDTDSRTEPSDQRRQTCDDTEIKTYEEKKKRKRGETIYAASKTKPKRRLFEEKKKKNTTNTDKNVFQ